MINEKIIKCENDYTKCFSEFYENGDIIRYRDNLLKDMYYHNYTYIKRSMNESELMHIIQDENSLRLSEKSDYCNIILNDVVSNSLITIFRNKPEVSTFGYYLFDVSFFSRLNALEDCLVKKVNSQKMIDDILFCDLKHDEKILGKDFCTRRC